jgi:hypothetical protein
VAKIDKKGRMRPSSWHDRFVDALNILPFGTDYRQTYLILGSGHPEENPITVLFSSDRYRDTDKSDHLTELSREADGKSDLNKGILKFI